MSREARNAALLGDVAVRMRRGAEAPGAPREFQPPVRACHRSRLDEGEEWRVDRTIPVPDGSRRPDVKSVLQPAHGCCCPGTGPESLGARYGMTDVPPPGGTCSGFGLAHVENLVTRL